jgi:hypothetical protein
MWRQSNVYRQSATRFAFEERKKRRRLDLPRVSYRYSFTLRSLVLQEAVVDYYGSLVRRYERAATRP